MQGEQRALIVLEWCASEMAKIVQFVMPKMSKITQICYTKNGKNHATFVERFWPEFYAHGRFMY